MKQMDILEFAMYHAEKTIQNDWVFEKGESFSKSFMVVGIISGRGTVPLLRVPARVKINAEYNVNYVLKPVFSAHLPRLFPYKKDKVYLHHNKESSDTANLTTSYLAKMKEELGVSYISKQNKPIKTPEGSQLDFFGLGYLKQRLLQRRARTLNGI